MATEPDPIPLAPPAGALEYARPGIEQDVPEFVPAVEAALDRRASIRAVTRPFRSTRVAAAYVSRSLARRFDAGSAGHACVQCGRPATRLIAYGWSFVVPTRWWITFRDKPLTANVNTCHAMCGACAQPLVGRAARIAKAKRWAARLGTAGGLLASVAFAVALTARTSVSPASDDGLATRAALVLGLIGGVALFCCLSLAAGSTSYARSRVPQPVRHAVPHWLTFEQFLGVFDRDAPAVRIASEESFWMN